ncbi:MAG: MerR family transcriptional regulator [Beduini sp.]|uniref:MerR family transcriptional regulator n=1 Tax=Beduini sp. TaxID=1922300 RepID=UPI0039A2AF67
MYTFKQVCQILNMSEHTLRHYTDNKLIPNPKRDRNNRRIYDEEDLDWLRGVKYLRDLGFSISEIQEYHEYCMFDDQDSLQMRERLLLKHQQIAKKNIDEAKKKYEYITKKIDYVDSLIKNNTIDLKNPRHRNKRK